MVLAKGCWREAELWEGGRAKTGEGEGWEQELPLRCEGQE